ncbi:MAG: 4Fe-4S cluster-binding domain-containing protein [Oscillospiraceae bacterium]|nr:4Fe-4S cluster-binding domain-containing protein [Oscillospiraceae bacterium]
MKVVAQANEAVLTILKRFLKTDFQGRLMKYCLAQQVEDGVLLFNLMTREMVLLTEEEYSRATELDYLRQRWFIVPEQLDEKECMEFVRLIFKSKTKSKGEITGYTIFTTTDCNARCFYCFELGRSRIPMSEETAHKTAEYIKSHCGGKKVKISWFGGEPLMNPTAIDIICDDLREAGIEFTSSMVSNGYLFDDALAEKAENKWNLKRIQITLDGTEDVYNRIKAFVYSDTNPYQIVLNNIRRLLDREIQVVIRLNMDLHNAEDLLVLAEELTRRFGGEKLLRVYAHHLFQDGVANAERYTDAEWNEREAAMNRLNEKLLGGGLLSRGVISRDVKMNHCMADNDKCITIVPDGNIGVCEHYSETEFVGHLDREGFDAEMVAAWKQTMPEVPECADCFYYPECYKLKKCLNESVCYPVFRRNQEEKVRQRMLNTYEKWLKAEGTENVLDEEDFVGQT